MPDSYDLAVIGLGALGSAAAYHGARAGLTVVGFEQFELGHARGASEDHTRIIRRSYHHPAYVTLADDAYREWEELEELSGERLVVRTGGLDLYPPEAEATRMIYQNAMDRGGVGYEVLTASEVKDRWPQFGLERDTLAVFQEDSGLVLASRATRAMRSLAVTGGARLFGQAKVDAIGVRGDEYRMVVGDEAFKARSLVVTADAWTNQVLANFGISFNLEVRQEQVSYFATGGATSFQPEAFPVWIWNADPAFYGLPDYQGTGLKIGQDVGGIAVTGDERSFEPDPEYSARIEQFLRGLVPTGWGEAILQRTCLYTLTPDREYVIDRVPGLLRSAVGLGAAHGFKFAPSLGALLVDLATETGRGQFDRQLFSAERPILSMPDPPRNYLV